LSGVNIALSSNSIFIQDAVVLALLAIQQLGPKSHLFDKASDACRLLAETSFMQSG
jgi:hypothetical protein